ncbi:MAG TPA: prolyl oligopeptidase family serine peptidase, partial [Gemmatimonadaceae bacterium]|nr:prolyl oligopeptidase family serine peptidase [Gemmatimonadaceae bacterium]
SAGLAAADARAQGTLPNGASFAFTIDNIMRGPEVYGREPQRPRFTPDGRWIYFRWLPPGTDWRETLRPYRVRAVAGASPEALTEAAWDSVAPALERGSRSPDRRSSVVSYRGDLYLVDLRSGAIRRLTQTAGAETDPVFGTDGRHVYFVRENNVFSLEVAGGLVRQLTDIRIGNPPKTDSAAGQRAALEAQQRALLESVRDRIRADSIAKAERSAREALLPKTLWLREKERVSSIRVSPDGRALLLLTEMPAGDAQRSRVPNYVTKSGYTEEIDSRTKVGDAEPAARVAYLRIPDGQPKWLRVVPNDSAPPDDLEIAGWNDDGSLALVVAISHDFKTRAVSTVSADSGAVRTVDTLRDSAWVDGPCVTCAGWLDGGRRIWFVSEADGWAHLYTMGAAGADRRQLTRGRWEVLDAELSDDRRDFYLHTSESSPYERQLWRMPLSGGARTRITTRAGSHDVTVSPDGALLADVSSQPNRPPELFLLRNAPGAPMAQLTVSPTREWLGFPWLTPRIVEIPASDGVNVPARIYRPADMGAKPNGAAVIFVHGAGYLHNVVSYWSPYPREYMFNQYLASKGYVVLDLDYRGSAGYGRDWRTAIYRHMGVRDLQDQIDASRWLRRELQLDPERVGIYGGSYGGFITLMALFTAPKEFGAGAALRSVTDWAHYNNGYTGRILNLPQSDTLAFRQSSPIYFAEGLEDPLLMAHGMVDTNVHFQDIVRLTERLIELRKSNWELAVYPVEDHAFVRPASWSDEYRRIFALFERTIGSTGTKAAEGATR